MLIRIIDCVCTKILLLRYCIFRSKITELTTEITSLTKETESASDDQSKYVTYEKR